MKFFITAVDAGNKPISFSMKKNKEGAWRLTSCSLRWLYDIKKELSHAIVESQTPKTITQ